MIYLLSILRYSQQMLPIGLCPSAVLSQAKPACASRHMTIGHLLRVLVVSRGFRLELARGSWIFCLLGKSQSGQSEEQAGRRKGPEIIVRRAVRSRGSHYAELDNRKPPE